MLTTTATKTKLLGSIGAIGNNQSYVKKFDGTTNIQRYYTIKQQIFKFLRKHHSAIRLDATQLNSTQSTSTHLNSTRLNSNQQNAMQFNVMKLNLTINQAVEVFSSPSSSMFKVSSAISTSPNAEPNGSCPEFFLPLCF